MDPADSTTDSDLSAWNRDLEAGDRTLPERVWAEWLWGADLHEPLRPTYNRAHLLGLLIARYRARFQPEAMAVRLNTLLPAIVHGGALASDLTLRQLREASEDLQMHWADHTADWDAALGALDALFARFGALCLVERPHDDLTAVDPSHPHRLSPAAIRRYTALFCVLYRHAHLAATATDLGGGAPAPNPHVQNYHVQAGLEAFYLHAMHADLPPAARILYKQDYAGMYHCPTQVVYYHFPSYERRRQLPLEAVRAGQPPINALSAALELHPAVRVVMEDELPPRAWHWALMGGGSVYLVGPDRRAWTGSSVWSLLALATGEGGSSAQPPLTEGGGVGPAPE